jgi:DNA-directed RNA polymerase specialized sigma24 family protein
VAASETERAIEAAWRLERPRVGAGLTRLVRDIAVAEDLAHDALVAALQQWPAQGIPRNAGAWLMAAGKRRAIDALRRRRTGTAVLRQHRPKGARHPRRPVHLVVVDCIGLDGTRGSTCRPLVVLLLNRCSKGECQDCDAFAPEGHACC